MAAMEHHGARSGRCANGALEFGLQFATELLAHTTTAAIAAATAAAGGGTAGNVNGGRGNHNTAAVAGVGVR